MERFCVYRTGTAMGILVLLILALAAVFGWLAIPLWLVLVLELPLFLGGWYYIATRSLVCLKRAANILDNQCDPYPLFHLCQELYPLLKNPVQRLPVLMDLALTHHDIGLSEESLKIMGAVEGMGLNNLPVPVRVVYYNNLSCFYLRVNQPEAAQAALQQAAALSKEVKNQEKAEKLKQLMQGPQAILALMRGEYATAFALMSCMSEENVRALVSKTFLRAKIHLALGEQEAARIALQYVIANANRLHCRVEAEEMLAALNA